MKLHQMCWLVKLRWPPWLSVCICIVTYQYQEGNTLYPIHLFFFGWFSMSFPYNKCNHKCTRFLWVLWTIIVDYWTWIWLWEKHLQWLILCVNFAKTVMKQYFKWFYVFFWWNSHLNWWILNRLSSIMWVGFTQSVEGLKRTKTNFP